MTRGCVHKYKKKTSHAVRASRPTTFCPRRAREQIDPRARVASFARKYLVCVCVCVFGHSVRRVFGHSASSCR
jgi:hypothetical protein